jgi:hypothetical protein
MKKRIKPNANEIDKENSISKLKRNKAISKHKTVIKYKGGLGPKRENKGDIKSNNGKAIKVDLSNRITHIKLNKSAIKPKDGTVNKRDTKHKDGAIKKKGTSIK